MIFGSSKRPLLLGEVCLYAMIGLAPTAQQFDLMHPGFIIFGRRPDCRF